MVDIAAAMAKRGFKALTDEDLCGNDITVVKCRACSGYGNCGYKTFRLYEGQPYSVCNLRLKKVQEGNSGESEEAEEIESAGSAEGAKSSNSTESAEGQDTDPVE